MIKNKVDIYLITNLLNNKYYVGQTCKGYKNRFNQHCLYALNKRKDCPQLIDRIIKKYGIKNFKCELLEKVSFEEKDVKEKYYIKKYNSYEKGYNLTIGGDYNPMLDKNIKDKHLKIMRDDNFRSKMSKSVLKAYTPELRKWFSNNSKIKWQNWTQDQRDKVLKGFKIYNNSRKQKIACLDENDNIIKKFESASEACKFFNKPTKEAGHILKICNKYNKNGKRAKHFGYSWIKL